MTLSSIIYVCLASQLRNTINQNRHQSISQERKSSIEYNQHSYNASKSTQSMWVQTRVAWYGVCCIGFMHRIYRALPYLYLYCTILSLKNDSRSAPQTHFGQEAFWWSLTDVLYTALVRFCTKRVYVHKRETNVKLKRLTHLMGWNPERGASEYEKGKVHLDCV